MRRLVTALAMTACLCLIPVTAASAKNGVPSTEEIQAYAHGYVRAKGGERQWRCFYKVLNYESHWNYRASNGIYYGLGQMGHTKARHNGKPYLQVRDAWKYMVNRYDRRACGAWEHIEKIGWY